VVHYDLCWNPTRHEQREGRVDRFGQARSAVRALMLHGGDSNPVDERVRTVILEKEKTIRKELGVSVPIPGNANTITQAVLGGIFGKAAQAIQGLLNLGLPGFGGSGSGSGADLDAVFDAEWQSARENAKATRTIFAQRSLKPDEALREGGHNRQLATRSHPAGRQPPGPERASAQPRSGRQVAALFPLSGPGGQPAAQPLPSPGGGAGGSRLGDPHQRRHQTHPGVGAAASAPAASVAEECLTVRVSADGLEALDGAAALELLEAPAIGNVDQGQRQQWLQEAVSELDGLQPALAAMAERRADLAEALRMRFRCEPSLPVDVIGLFLMLPAPQL
jgi:hypothetical protein